MNEANPLRIETGVDDAAFRVALSRFATGIAIVTARKGDGQPCAMTVNSFTSVSLDPPLVLFCLGSSAFNVDVFASADAFAVNILAADQQALSDRFAQKAIDHFSDLDVGEMTTGSPILTGCLAALDCETEARHEAGDHLIVIGRVCAVDLQSEGLPLLHFRSRYRKLMPGGEG